MLTLETAQKNISSVGFLNVEIDPTLDLFAEIEKLKKEKNAILLAHYYQEADIQDYINCTAAIKAQTDIICTSSNAKYVVESVPKDTGIIFAPDRNLGAWLQKETGRDMVLWDGSCMVHEIFSLEKIVKLKEVFPEAQIIAHPECEQSILDIADFIGSTSQLLKYSKDSKHKEFIVVTESGIIHQMKKNAPGKTFIPAPGTEDTCACNDCPHMKLNTLEKIYLCMKYEMPEILMEESLRLRSKQPIDRMLEISREAGLIK